MDRSTFTWSSKAHISALGPPPGGGPKPDLSPLPRSPKEDGLEGREIPRHLPPKEGKKEAYPQNPPGIGARKVPSLG
ncbi:hypothetical protein Thermus77420_16330 [Thermus thalpophilus]